MEIREEHDRETQEATQNVKFALVYAVKTYGSVEVQLYTFLILALYRDEWSASRPGGYSPGKTPSEPIE